jgi:hypothetical protein
MDIDSIGEGSDQTDSDDDDDDDDQHDDDDDDDDNYQHDDDDDDDDDEDDNVLGNELAAELADQFMVAHGEAGMMMDEQDAPLLPAAGMNGGNLHGGAGDPFAAPPPMPVIDFNQKRYSLFDRSSHVLSNIV